MTSSPLLTRVAELMVMTGPMRHVGWASACSGVTSASSAEERPRNGPPLAVMLSNQGWNPYAVIAVMVLIGTAFGLASGVLVEFVGMQPFIATLTMMFLARGIASTLSTSSERLDPDSPPRSLPVRHVPPGPRGQDLAREAGVRGIGQQVVGSVQRHERLGIPRGLEDPMRVRDRDDLVVGSVEDQEGLAEPGDRGRQVLVGQVVQEPALDPERAARQHEPGFLGALELGGLFQQGLPEMLGPRRGADRGDGRRLLDQARGHQHGRAAQAVTDQEPGRPVLGAEPVGGRDQVLDVGREVGFRKVPLALPESREVEA